MEDPKRTAPVTDIKYFAVHDGDGIRTTVFLKGCPLRCVWCHNPEGLNASPQMSCYANKCINCGNCRTVCESGAQRMPDGIHQYDRSLCNACGRCESICPVGAMKRNGVFRTVDEILPLLLRDQNFYISSGGGVTVSGGECLLYPEFTASLLRKIKENSINTAVDTCGFVSQDALRQVLPYTDTFLYDIKAMDEEVHIRCTGQSNRLILENIRFLDAQNARIEVRIPYVPGYNADQMEKIAVFLTSLRNLTGVRILPYHNYAGSKYASLGMENTLPKQLPAAEEIAAVQELFWRNGIPVRH